MGVSSAVEPSRARGLQLRVPQPAGSWWVHGREHLHVVHRQGPAHRRAGQRRVRQGHCLAGGAQRRVALGGRQRPRGAGLGGRRAARSGRPGSPVVVGSGAGRHLQHGARVHRRLDRRVRWRHRRTHQAPALAPSRAPRRQGLDPGLQRLHEHHQRRPNYRATASTTSPRVLGPISPSRPEPVFWSTAGPT